MQAPCIIANVLNTKGYSVDWRDVVRPNVLKRDKYKCMHCGVGNRAMYSIEGGKRVILDDDWLLKNYINKGAKVIKVSLNIAHQCCTKACINELHLLTLCCSCHLVFDRHHNLINRLINAANKSKK
jgi:hypothetical protein